MRNKIANVLHAVGDVMQVPEQAESKTLKKSFIALDSDPTKATTIKDQLHGEYIDKLRQFILSVKTPFVLSINGSWGRGKTFLIEHVLNNEMLLREYGVVRIDAWEVPESQPSMPYILAQIAEQLGADDNVKNALVTAGASVASFGMLTANTQPFGLLLIALSLILKMTVNETKNRSQKIDELRKKFAGMIKNYLRNKNKSALIVFIDNLDRCVPEQCVTFLDQLAKFLKTEHCIFILALDQEIIEGAIHQRYGANIPVTADTYLEKIIDLSLTPPAPRVANLIELLGDRFETMTDSPELRADMRNALRQFSQVSMLMQTTIAKNPRKMFRILKLLSTHLHFEGIQKIEKLNNMLPELLFMSIIKAYKPIFFSALQKEPGVGIDILKIQSGGKAVTIYGQGFGGFGLRDLQDTKNIISAQFKDSSFIDDPECAILIEVIAHDLFHRKLIPLRNEEFESKISEIVAIVNAMSV